MAVQSADPPLARRIHPANPSSEVKDSPISIVDNSVVFYTSSGATWFFPASARSAAAFEPDLVARSLSAVLDAYPHLCGRLYMPTYDAQKAKTDHNARYGRLRLRWGGQDEPGTHLEFQQDERPMSAVLTGSSEPDEKILTGGDDADILPSPGVIANPRTPLDDTEQQTKVAVAIRVITFACGGHSISTAFLHALADAQHLTTFMRDWSAHHSAMMVDTSTRLRPDDRTFRPELLDRFAAGDIDAESRDEGISAKAESLPMLRLDWWASSECKPPFMTTPSDPPAVLADQSQQRGKRIPWENVNWAAKNLARLLLFSPAEIAAIQKQTVSGSQDGGLGSGKVSKQDCLLALVWRLLTQARLEKGSISDKDELSLDLTAGLRSRVNPPLPASFGGSPIVNLSARLSVHSLVNDEPITTAQAIRQTVMSLTPDKTAALLHHMAYDLDSIRHWNAFFGEKNLLVTSWLDTSMYDIDFGSGQPVEVRPNMPPVDGLMCIVETPPVSTTRSARWSENGVGVRVSAEEGVMLRFLDLLRASRARLSVQ